jgi:predicted secreted Zn-dependent protease
VTGLVWRRAARCADGNCVEVATRPGMVLVRDSKLDDSPVLAFDRETWAVFVAGVRAGEFG